MDNVILDLGFGDGGNNIGNIVGAAAEIISSATINEIVFPEEREGVVRNKNYYESIVPLYSNDQFREHFRMSRGTYEVLLNHVARVHSNPNDQIHLSKKLLATIWLLSKPESFLACGDRFGLPKSTLHGVFNEMISSLSSMAPEFIVWPNQERLQQSARIFHARSRGIPGVVGAVDGSHIAIQQPVGNAFDYYNRKGFHSIILQGVCDENGVFTDVCIGSPGRMHDARVFRLSPLYERLTTIDFLPHFHHIIGDSAYPLLTTLMKPYQDNGHLSREQQIYNTKLSAIRSSIERTFGMLKTKFRRLKYLEVNQPETASKIVMACCVLHNFILMQGNTQDDYNLQQEDISDDMPLISANEYGRNNPAEQKRQTIVNMCS